MSRKWERMVEKNRKKVNDQRKKQGQKEKIGSSSAEGSRIEYYGRSLIISFILLTISVVFGLSMMLTGNTDGLYWFTVISYAVLSAYFYFLKRPYLGIGKNQLFTRRMGVIRHQDAEDIAQITHRNGVVNIKFKGKQPDWRFSRRINRFDTDAMAGQLDKFAAKFSIPFKK